MIDLVARLFNMSSYEAAQKLASGIFDLTRNRPLPQLWPKPKASLYPPFREDEMLCFRVLTDYLHLLED